MLIALFNKNLVHQALGCKRANKGGGFVYQRLFFYIFGKFLRLIISKVFPRTCHSLTSLFNRTSQIGGPVLWEHQVAGSNPVAPTLKNQVILASYPDSLFYFSEVSIIQIAIIQRLLVQLFQGYQRSFFNLKIINQFRVIVF